MFNPLSPPEMISAIGRAAREAARSEGALSEFERGQLKSGYSASRHLAVEIAAFPSERARFRSAVQALVPEAEIPEDEPGLARFVSELLQSCRDLDQADTRRALQRLLRDLCDREVALLAAAIEAPR